VAEPDEEEASRRPRLTAPRAAGDLGDEGFDHEQLQIPSRLRVVWTRAFCVLIVLFILVVSGLGLGAHEGSDLWLYGVSAVALVSLLPLVVSAWSRAVQPYPHDRTMLILSRTLAAKQRKLVDRALRQGRAGDIAPAHFPYARARTAHDGREVASTPGMTFIFWAGSLNAARDDIGSWWFWLFFGGAVAATAAAYRIVIVQRRRERVVSELYSVQWPAA
jgi:hypothetical protein